MNAAGMVVKTEGIAIKRLVNRIWASILDHICKAPYSNEGYRFSRVMESPAFISLDDILNIYVPMGYSNFKIEGRDLGNAPLLEFILYYMVKPQYQIHVREEMYLDAMLDLF